RSRASGHPPDSVPVRHRPELVDRIERQRDRLPDRLDDGGRDVAATGLVAARPAGRAPRSEYGERDPQDGPSPHHGFVRGRTQSTFFPPAPSAFMTKNAHGGASGQ